MAEPSTPATRSSSRRSRQLGNKLKGVDVVTPEAQVFGPPPERPARLPQLRPYRLTGRAWATASSAVQFEAVAINSDDRRPQHLTPESLGRCINLRALDASNNDLAELPCSLGTLPKLQRIALDGNPLRSVRRDVIERGCEAVKAFLRTRAATPAEKTSEDDFDPLALANRVRDPVCVRRLLSSVASMALPERARRPKPRRQTFTALAVGSGVCAKVRESLERDGGLTRTRRLPKTRGRRASRMWSFRERPVGTAGGVVLIGAGDSLSGS